MIITRLLISLFLSQFIVGCYFTPRLWQAEEHFAAKGRDFTESNIKIDSANIYYSDKHNSYCMSYHVLSNEKTQSKSILMPTNEKSTITKHESLFDAQNEFKIGRRFAEYRRFKKLPPKDGPSADKDWLQEILTIGIYVPIISNSDQINKEDPGIEKRFYKGMTQPVSNYIYPSVTLYHPLSSFWPTSEGANPSYSLVNYLLKSTLNISPKRILTKAWVNKDGGIISKGDSILPPLDENRLLLEVLTEDQLTFYGYRSLFFSMLEKYGAFRPSSQAGGPDIYLISYDKENNQALIGFQLIKNTFGISANKVIKDVDCTSDDWQLLLDSNNDPYPLIFVESEEKRVYHYSLLTRTAMTPLAVAGDIISAPFWLFYIVGVGIWGM